MLFRSLEAALNGATPKRVNPNVPRSSDELVRDALACLAGGAAIVHTHTDEPAAPAARAAALYAAHFAPVLAERPDALLYPTVGYAKTVEESFAHFELLAQRLALRIGIIDPGCVNLASFAYVNTPDAIRHMAALCERLRLGPSIAVFEPGFLRHALGYFRRGALPRGALVKFYLGGTYPKNDPEVDFEDFDVLHEEFDEEVWPILAERVPAFEGIKVVNFWAGHYDFCVLDHNAIVGPHPRIRNLLFANGFSGHGLQQAPAVGRGIAEWIATGRYQSLDLSPLGYERIERGAPIRELNVV